LNWTAALARLGFPYDKFVQFRDQALAEEDKANALFDKRLAEEEVWIRKGIQARRTRNEGRVRALIKCARSVPPAVPAQVV
jgi:ATPase components of ABC transporters with duplicated ATPase domains